MAKFQKVCLIRFQLDGHLIERVYDQNPIFVGRSTEAHVSISDPSVSRLHLEIFVRHGRVWVVDLGSANGSFINNVRLEPKSKTAYNPGDLLQIGNKMITVGIDMYEKAFDIQHIKTSSLNVDEREQLMGFIQAAHAEAHRIHQLTKEQAEQLLKSTEAKSASIVSQANLNADDIISMANNEARRIVQDGQKRHDELVTRSLDDAEVKMREILAPTYEEKERILANAALESKKLMTQIQEEAQQKAATIIASAESEKVEILEQYDLQAQQKISEAEKEFQLIVEEAQILAERIVTEAKAEAAQLSDLRLAAQEKKKEISQLELSLIETEKITKEKIQQSENLCLSKIEEIETTTKEKILLLEKKMSEAHEQSNKKKTELDRALNEYALQISVKKSELDQSVDKYKEEAQTKKEELDEGLQIFSEEIGEKKRAIQKEIAEIQFELKEKGKDLKMLDEDIASAEKHKQSLITSIDLGKVELAKGKEIRESSLIEVDQAKKALEEHKQETELQLKDMREKTYKSVEEYRSKEIAEIDKLKLQEIQALKIQQAEALNALNAKKGDLVNQLLSAVEAQILNLVKPSLPKEFNWSPITAEIQSTIKMDLEEMIFRTAQGSDVQDPQRTQTQLHRTHRRIKWMAASIAAVLTLVMIIPKSREQIYSYFSEHGVNQAAKNFSDQLQAERSRVYKPERILEWKESYTDAILYSHGYSELKLDPVRQDKWIRKLHEFLFSQLRVDEDSVVKLVSQETALISTLKEQADKIHPDFVTERVKKMKELEAESVQKMKEIIGSEELYGKFKNFSKDYYEQEMSQRTPAQTEN